MSIEDKAQNLDEMFCVMSNARRETAAEAEALLMKWDTELEPVKQVMKKHRILFRNAAVPYTGSYGSLQGIVIGSTAKIPHRLIVLKTHLAVPVNGETDKADDTGAIPLQTFLETADLETVKAGFDFVRNLDSDAVKDMAKRNEQLKEFVSKNT
ncbi:MAG: hypothetical protein LBT88_06020 [Oscillospiraceae bacterium]|jgi:hypothetical protein|nr:hypothetical protein [Oscillospiraceae bacterium]